MKLFNKLSETQSMDPSSFKGVLLKRLSIMEAIAATKFPNLGSVSDPAREKIVIDNIREKCLQRSYTETKIASIIQIFIANMTLAKLIQTACITEWGQSSVELIRTIGLTSAQRIIAEHITGDNLLLTLRSYITGITDEMLDALDSPATLDSLDDLEDLLVQCFSFIDRQELTQASLKINREIEALKPHLFYIKKQQRNVEDHFWLGTPLSEPYPLNDAKIISEIIGLSFYQMMGVITPKTYVSHISYGPVIISKKIYHWHDCKVGSQYFGQQLEALPPSIVGLAELELASAFLGDIDVTGWLYDNIGIHECEDLQHRNSLYVTKHDAGSAIVENEQFLHFKKYFSDSLDIFPDGTMTLDDNQDLTNTYLKIFNHPNVTRYNEHYKNVFLHITPAMRRAALKKLFLISIDNISSMVCHIGRELDIPEQKQHEIIHFMGERLAIFNDLYFTVVTQHDQSEANSDLFNQPVFKRLTEQNHIVREPSYLMRRFAIQSKDETNYSQSSARFFKKIPNSLLPSSDALELDGRTENLRETIDYFH